VWNGSQESINHDDEFYYILGFLPLPQCAVCRECPQTGPVARLRARMVSIVAVCVCRAFIFEVTGPSPLWG
jgi:hypothetical protein